jgi:hypothetical protein
MYPDIIEIVYLTTLGAIPTAIRQHSTPSMSSVHSDADTQVHSIPLTANGRAAEDAGNACLELFFHWTPATSKDALVDLLDAAWAESPDETLRIIFMTGNCRKKEVGSTPVKMPSVFIQMRSPVDNMWMSE